MAKKRYRPEEIIAKLREAEVLLAQGMKVPEVAKSIGIHEITFYRWRKEYGGMKVSYCPSYLNRMYPYSNAWRWSCPG